MYQGTCFLHHNAPCKNLPPKTSPLFNKSVGHGFNGSELQPEVEEQVLGVRQDGAEELGSHDKAAHTFTLLLGAKDTSQHHQG